jgi:hypothetical protein
LKNETVSDWVIDVVRGYRKEVVALLHKEVERLRKLNDELTKSQNIYDVSLSGLEYSRGVELLYLMGEL